MSTELLPFNHLIYFRVIHYSCPSVSSTTTNKKEQPQVIMPPKKDPSDSRQPPPITLENEPEIIRHEPAAWNGFRSSSSRGQLLREFIEQGLPVERAKEKVEEEFAARNPVVRPPKGGGASRSTAGSSSTKRVPSPTPSKPRKAPNPTPLKPGRAPKAPPAKPSRAPTPPPSKPSRYPSPSPSEPSRSPSPPLSIPIRGRPPATYSAHNGFGRSSRQRSPSPELDTRPPVALMTLEALRQELLSEERMPAWIQVIMKQFCDMGTTLPRPPPNNNCRRRVQPSPPGAMPPGLLWTSDPVRDRNTDRLLSLYMGFNPCAVKIFCDEQYGPETDADRVQRLKSDADPARFLIFQTLPFPQNCAQGWKNFSPDIVKAREMARQYLFSRTPIETSEEGIKALLDDIFGPETEANRAARKPGPDWGRIWDICSAHKGS